MKSETTARGRAVNGLPRAAAKPVWTCSRDGTRTRYRAARMLVRENDPPMAEIEWHRGNTASGTLGLLGAFIPLKFRKGWMNHDEEADCDRY